MVSDGFLTGLDAPLEIELSVPSDLVGSIIGRQGQVVRELQLQTGVVIKIPKQSETNSSEETPIHIIGSYFSTVVSIKRFKFSKVDCSKKCLESKI